MDKVFIIMWLGFPKFFGSYDGAKSWLHGKIPYLSEEEVRTYFYVNEII